MLQLSFGVYSEDWFLADLASLFAGVGSVPLSEAIMGT